MLLSEQREREWFQWKNCFQDLSSIEHGWWIKGAFEIANYFFLIFLRRIRLKHNISSSFQWFSIKALKFQLLFTSLKCSMSMICLCIHSYEQSNWYEKLVKLKLDTFELVEMHKNTRQQLVHSIQLKTLVFTPFIEHSFN